MANFNVTSVRPAPAGFDEGCKALVTFTFQTDEFTGAARIVRYVKGENGEAGKVYEVGKCVGKVQVIDAPLMARPGDKGPWLQSGAIEVPDEVRRAVVSKAWAMFTRDEQQRLGQVPAGAAPVDPDFPN